MLAVLVISLLGMSQFVAASLLIPNHPTDAWLITPFTRLLSRQTTTPTVPVECKAECDPINTQAQQGCPPANCCQATFVTQYFNCEKCVGMSLGATDYSLAQSLLDNLITQCTVRGFSVPKLTLPGIDPNRPLSTLASSRPTTTGPAASALVSGPANTAPTTIIQSTVSIAAPGPPNLPTTLVPPPPPPPPTPVSGQQTETTVPQNTPRPAETNGVVFSHRLSTPQFSHFIILGALLVASAYLVA